MNALRNILVGAVVLATIAFAIWLAVKVVTWCCYVVGRAMGSWIDTIFSPDAMHLYGRILAVATVIVLSWLIGRRILRKK